jgi:hypothetical protein
MGRYPHAGGKPATGTGATPGRQVNPWPRKGAGWRGKCQETLAAQQAKVGVLEARLAETQSQAVALEAMYQELSSSRDERLLAEVEQAVVIAMQQLQFSGNVEAALIALQGAEAPPRAFAVQPQFLPVQQADRARHRAPQGHPGRQHQRPVAEDRKRGHRGRWPAAGLRAATETRGAQGRLPTPSR